MKTLKRIEISHNLKEKLSTEYIKKLEKQIKDMKCCGNCIYFLSIKCDKKKKVDENQWKHPDPRDLCISWDFNKNINF
jgi:hypothetical protein